MIHKPLPHKDLRRGRAAPRAVNPYCITTYINSKNFGTLSRIDGETGRQMPIYIVDGNKHQTIGFTMYDAIQHAMPYAIAGCAFIAIMMICEHKKLF